MTRLNEDRKPMTLEESLKLDKENEKKIEEQKKEEGKSK